MNKIILIGNLTRDPELRETQNGTPVCNFSIAVNRPYKDEDGNSQADFFNCTAWESLGERVGQYLSKGKKAMVEGYVQQRQYTDKDNIERTAFDIVATNVEFLSPKTEDEEESKPTTRQAQKPSRNGQRR